MNQKVIELKQQYVNDTERIRHMISNKRNTSRKKNANLLNIKMNLIKRNLITQKCIIKIT
ncbi:hypothetical protein J4714_11790 [Staphylococcus epidermidis]|nr:hypothetical protein [Staphylococcus epidermidis]MBO1996634.1 hypothetical protein [Staphylococcus epidermidis]MBO1996651.1 hypothetical protein [Staphylococcus epidermidis]